jgi:hypothetical protein
VARKADIEMRLWIWLAPAGWNWLKPSHEGLERELNWFNQLEGGMDTMSAPGDQGYSTGFQRLQPELNAPLPSIAGSIVSRTCI